MASAAGMFKPRTLLIVGAGASKEAGLPVGDELTSIIASRLQFEVDDWQRAKWRDKVIGASIDAKVRKGSFGDGRELFKAARKVANGMELATSIDSYMDNHRSDSAIGFCGKLAIVRTILEAERASKLFIPSNRSGETLDFLSLNSSWYVRFFKLTPSCRSMRYRITIM